MADYDKDYTNTAPSEPTLSESTFTDDIVGYNSTAPVEPTLSEEFSEIEIDADPDAVLSFDDPNFTDYTTEATEDTADDVPLYPDEDVYLYIGCSETFYGISINVTTAGIGAYAIYDTQYSYGESSWVTMDSVGDVSGVDFKAVSNESQIWDVPDDWVEATYDSKEYYWIRVRITGAVTTNPLAGRIKVVLTAVSYEESWGDTLSISDSSAFSFNLGKNVSETMSLADSYSDVVSFARSFSDTMNIGDTDQFHWNSGLNLSDLMAISDAAAGAFKMDYATGWTDIMSLSDSLMKTVMQNVTDTLTMIDSLLKNMPMWFEEQLLISDAFVKNIGKVFVDIVAITELVHIGNFMLFADQMNIVDALVKQVGKVFADTVTITDVVVYTVGKNMSDNLALSDVYALSGSVAWLDQLVIADDLYKALVIAETEPQVVGVLASPDTMVLPWMPYIAIGTSNIKEEDVSGRITSLMAEVHRKQGTVKVIANTYFVRAEFGQDEPTADDLTLYEIGIFDAETGGTMAERWVLDTGISKDNIDEIVIECAITILHGDMLTHLLSFTGEAGAEMLASVLSGGGSSVAGAKDSVSISDTLTWKLNDVEI